MLVGVAGGLGERLGVDPVLVRVAFAVLAIAGGSGVLLYLVAWAVSVEPDAAVASPAPARRPLARQNLALGMMVLGALLLLRELGLWFGDPIAWPVALAAAGAAVIWARSDDRDRARWTRAGARIPGNPVEALFTGRVGLVRVVVGGLLVAMGMGLGLANQGTNLAAASGVLLAMATTAAGLGLIFGPWTSRLARQVTGRPKILVYAYCYHGSVDETVASLVQFIDGEQAFTGAFNWYRIIERNKLVPREEEERTEFPLE